MNNKFCRTSRSEAANPARRRCAAGLLLVCAGLAGCTPPGPRSLLDGERLIKQGRFPEAIGALQRATSLLPRNAQAWNHLGLAYHGAQQFDRAQEAYIKSLNLDPRLAAPHYNLGCLYLEQTNLPAATAELTAYALLQPASIEARLKLGVAHLRARRLDEAESLFKATLDMSSGNTQSPGHLQALNNLGVVKFQRRNSRDAFNYFNLAVTKTNYGPALLNLAVINQQSLNNRAAALKFYRQYLASQPRPADAAAVEAIANQLDADLNPPALILRPITAAPPPPVRTTTVVVPTPPTVRTAATVAIKPPPLLPPPVTSAPPVSIQHTSVAVTKTNPVVAIATAAPPVVRPTAPIPVPVPTPPVVPTNPPVIASLPVATPTIPATEIREDLVIKPAQDLPGASPSPPPPPPPPSVDPAIPSKPAGESLVVSSPKAGEEPDRRSFISRINPFSGKPKSPAVSKSGPTNSPILVAQNQAPKVAAKPPPPRYPFQTPAPVRPGNRAAAEPAFARGVKAHQARQPARAVQEYQIALSTDPAYFDAYYNMGAAARDAGQLGLALAAYEGALAVKPDSADARYNFALTLKAAGYTPDAADQLDRLLRASPDEVRAHLALANLYSQQLDQPAQAREHYLRVLALNPNHAEASRIRTWLTANP